MLQHLDRPTRRADDLLRLAVVVLALVSGWACVCGNPTGTRCDPDTYVAHCAGQSAIAYCSANYDGYDNAFPEEKTRPCKDGNVCFDGGSGVVGCVADPPQTCSQPWKQKRCVDGHRQFCVELRQHAGANYWVRQSLECK